MWSSAAHAVDVVGSNQATFQWAPASGPVAGYYVIVSRDGGQAQVESTSLDTSEMLTGAYGETLVVQVAAFGTDGVAGPLSAGSDPITFVAGGGGDPPPPDGGGDGGGGGDPGSGGDPGGAPPPDGDPGEDPGGSASSVHADHDADGAADIALRVGPAARLWLMQGEHVAGEMPLPLIPSGAQLVGNGDYDGNLSSDMLWENPETGELTLWLFDAGAVIGAGLLDRSSLPGQERWKVGGSGDFDGDGSDEVMLFSRVRGETEVWTLDASGVASRTRHAGYAGAWSVAAVADTNGDGLAEVVWMDELQRDLVVEAPGGAPLVLGQLAPTWRVLAAADADGNGRAELLVHEPATGAMQSWHLDAQGIASADDLPPAPGELGGCGDFDADGRDDVAWSDSDRGVVTLWMGTGGAPLEVEADLPLGGAEMLPAAGSDDGEFRERFCNGDVDGNGWVSSTDLTTVIAHCLKNSKPKRCAAADLNGDGQVTVADSEIFLMRFSGQLCEDR